MKGHGPEELRPPRSALETVLAEEGLDIGVALNQKRSSVPLDLLLGGEEQVRSRVETAGRCIVHDDRDAGGSGETRDEAGEIVDVSEKAITHHDIEGLRIHGRIAQIPSQKRHPAGLYRRPQGYRDGPFGRAENAHRVAAPGKDLSNLAVTAAHVEHARRWQIAQQIHGNARLGREHPRADPRIEAFRIVRGCGLHIGIFRRRAHGRNSIMFDPSAGVGVGEGEGDGVGGGVGSSSSRGSGPSSSTMILSGSFPMSRMSRFK